MRMKKDEGACQVEKIFSREKRWRGTSTIDGGLLMRLPYLSKIWRVAMEAKGEGTI